MTVVIPIYNDWVSFSYLLRDLDWVAERLSQPLHILAVDDGSAESWDSLSHLKFSPQIRSIDIVQLVRNLGHQRAICIGLVEAISDTDSEAIIVMDGDGEDIPDSIAELIGAYQVHHNNIVVGIRGKRHEAVGFRLFYILYKSLFRILVGKQINFGNYCLIPISIVNRLTYDPNLWNHLAATIVRATLPILPVLVNRGSRYNGQSKMNFESLVMHGLSAISVFIDVIFLRLMILSGIMAMMATIAIAVVIGILLFTKLAIPGWASSVVGIMTIIIFQIVIFSSSAVFFILNQRSTNVFIPALDTQRLIKKREAINTHE